MIYITFTEPTAHNYIVSFIKIVWKEMRSGWYPRRFYFNSSPQSQTIPTAEWLITTIGDIWNFWQDNNTTHKTPPLRYVLIVISFVAWRSLAFRCDLGGDQHQPVIRAEAGQDAAKSESVETTVTGCWTTLETSVHSNTGWATSPCAV